MLLHSNPTFNPLLLLAVCVLVLISFRDANGQVAMDIVETAKAATALVERPSGDGFGTAFCIDKAGFFVTNEHVIRGESEQIPLILNPGTAKETKVLTEIARFDKKADLALLRAIQPPSDLKVLSLGREAGLRETQQVTVFGYPFGTALALRNAKYPNISINVGRITSLRRQNKQLQLIQLDAVVNPGNSGGPVLDEGGNVIGVVVEKVVGTDVNFAIPVSKVRDFLATPELFLEKTKIRFAERHKPTNLVFKIVSFSRLTDQLKVEVKVTNGIGGAENILIERPNVNGQWVASFVPVKPDEKPLRIPVTISYRSGTVKGEMIEQELLFAGSKQYITEMKSIVKAANNTWTLTRYDGKKATKSGLEFSDPNVYLGGATSRIDLDTLTKIEIGEVNNAPHRLKFEAKVYAQEKLVSILKGTIPLEGAPIDSKLKSVDANEPKQPAEVTKNYTLPNVQPQFEDDELVYEFESPFTDYVMGGADRFMIFKFADSNKVAIFDVIKGDIVHEIDNVSPDAILCAGARRLFIILPNQMLVQRWNLFSFEREKTTRIAVKESPKVAYMGVNSDNHFLLFDGKEGYLFDVSRLKPISIDEPMLARHASRGYAIDVSADGNTFGLIPIGIGPVPYEALLVADTSIIQKSFSKRSNSYRWAAPSPNGRLFFLPSGQIFNAVFKDVSPEWLEGSRTLPTVDPRYFISVRLRDAGRNKKGFTVDICNASDLKIVHGNIRFKELDASGNTNAISYVKRKLDSGQTKIHYIPWANLFAYTGYDQKRVFLRKYNLFESLSATGEDYLFVNSLPPLLAYKGKKLNYQISCLTNADSIQFELVQGPKGMKVSSTGLVTWIPSRGAPEEFLPVVVGIKSSNGDEIFHTFDVFVAAKRTRRN